jgi:hypothetical protein
MNIFDLLFEYSNNIRILIILNKLQIVFALKRVEGQQITKLEFLEFFFRVFSNYFVKIWILNTFQYSNK